MSDQIPKHKFSKPDVVVIAVVLSICFITIPCIIITNTVTNKFWYNQLVQQGYAEWVPDTAGRPKWRMKQMYSQPTVTIEDGKVVNESN